MKFDKRNLLLYAVTDRTWLQDQTLYQQVEQVLQGGASIIQLREKTLNEDLFLQEAKELKMLCQKYHVPLIINDNIKIAQQINADGVHVGQKDMNAKNVRQIIGDNKILGVSVQTVEQAILAQQNGADYLGVGAVFHTNSKTDAIEVTYKTLHQICSTVTIPVVAIGGIHHNNILELAGSGICGVAIISAIFSADNIKKATENLKQLAEQIL